MRTSKKLAKRPRGRPLGHDPKRVQQLVRDAFWETGFSGTSLDRLAAAAEVNRPTLYAAFGDKRSMYLAAIESFCVEMRADAVSAFARPTLADALRQFYASAIDRYLSGKSPRGCLVVCTAVVEATHDADVRRVLKAVLAELDAHLARGIERGQRAGQIASTASPALLAQLSAAVLHSIAVRARAGETRAALEGLAEQAVELVCGAKPRSGRGKRGA